MKVYLVVCGRMYTEGVAISAFASRAAAEQFCRDHDGFRNDHHDPDVWYCDSDYLQLEEHEVRQ